MLSQAPLTCQLPRIEISPAPHKDKSPSTSPLYEDPLSSRPKYLSPPPRYSPNESTARLVAQAAKNRHQGLERIRFENLLRASRDRKAALQMLQSAQQQNGQGGRKNAELRKEVVNIVQKNRQAERRQRFLAKLSAPPSPSAINVPVTPPESPSIFHYSLPSPGLVSPLDFVISTACNNPTKWVEEIDFHHQKMMKTAALPGRKSMPTLEDITSRYVNKSQLPPTRQPTRPPLPNLDAIVSRYANKTSGQQPLVTITKQATRPPLPKFLTQPPLPTPIHTPPPKPLVPPSTPLTPPQTQNVNTTLGPVAVQQPWKPLRVPEKITRRLSSANRKNPPPAPLTEANLMQFTYPRGMSEEDWTPSWDGDEGAGDEKNSPGKESYLSSGRRNSAPPRMEEDEMVGVGLMGSPKPVGGF